MRFVQVVDCTEMPRGGGLAPAHAKAPSLCGAPSPVSNVPPCPRSALSLAGRPVQASSGCSSDSSLLHSITRPHAEPRVISDGSCYLSARMNELS